MLTCHSLSLFHHLVDYCCSIAHAYLLADNRHYTFYLWRKVIHSHQSTKYLLVPLYVYSWFSIFRVLGQYLLSSSFFFPFPLSSKILFGFVTLIPFLCHLLARKARPKIWVLAYFLATAAVLVPAPLIEFRYYTIPFYFLMLHSHTVDIQSLVLIGVGYVVTNVFTMFMFLFRPFNWSHEPGKQRFLWQIGY